jgi:hypothetical protein
MAPDRTTVGIGGIDRMQTQLRTTLVLGLLLALVASDAQAWGKKKKQQAPVAPVPVVVAPPPPPPPPPQSIFFGDPAVAPQIAQTDLLLTASPEVQSVARWIGSSRDNGGMPFLLVDKANAQAYVFNPLGQLVATAPVLLGMGKGDRMLVPNSAPMSAIPPQKRITPAGRYMSRLAIDSHGKEILVIDYDASLSLHPIVKGTPAEHRAQRMASPTSEDNRVSFGCINVPVAFYSTIVSPTFANKMGVVYILPETLPASQQFGFQPDPVALPVTPQVSTATTAAEAAAPAAQAAPPATSPPGAK